MLREIFRFELRYHLTSPLLWGTGLFFALLTFGAITSDSVTIGGGIGNVHRNSPFVIVQMLSVMSVIAVFVTTAFVASSALRDFERGSHELFFSKPLRKFDYLAGRFVGSLLASLGVMTICALGILVGSFMPWLEPERLGPTTIGPYLFALLVLVLPNLLFSGALFFALASLSRSWLVTYIGVVVFFGVYLTAALMLSDLDNQGIGALLDPFGSATLDLVTRYWTVAEKNHDLPPLAGPLLQNRLLWSAIGAVILGLAFATFRTSAAPGLSRSGRRSRREPRAASDPTDDSLPEALPAPGAAARDFSPRGERAMFRHALRHETLGVLRSIPFLVILAFGMFNVVGGAAFRFERFGTEIYPVTQLMIEMLQGSFVFLLVIIVTFYAGELVWKERSLAVAEVQDAMPVPNWVPLAAKLAAQWLVVVAFLVVGGLTAIGIQLSNGYTRLEPSLYARGLLLEAMPFLLIAVLATFLQVVANQKFVGYLLVILYLISQTVLDSLDFDHRLYRYGSSPDLPYSDMNGYGHFLPGYLWFKLYWACFALLLLGLASLLWVRGSESSWRLRLRAARQRCRGPVRLVLAAGLIGWVACGVWIFWNTNLRNEYVPGDERERRQAEYEKRYRQYKDLVGARVVDVETTVDIFPAERRVEIAGRYRLKNKSAQPVGVIHLQIDPKVRIDQLSLRPEWRERHDELLGYSIYRLPEPLAPGAEMNLDFELTVQERGFVNQGSDTSLVHNGTFFNNQQYFPQLAYDESRQLQDRNDRRDRGLEPVQRMPKVDDLFARRNSYLTADSDWIGFRTTVSTSADQVALAPGYLVREWRQGDRRYFRYEMDSPILHFYSYLSARWAVRRDRWRDVAIEIYYHPDHAYNVERMVDAVKKSLDYCTVNFSPYQHRQVRILEFPGYASFAQSFPNTIPYSESIGFVADLRDPESIDYVFYVTAHEVAHQWWAHQVIGGNVQGSTMLSESLAQYTALMVMEHEYGKEKMRRFLKYELDSYLRGRGVELVEELPLALVENQPYIHYRKGSLVFYALQEAIGEATLNGALARFVRERGFQEPPFTHSPELLAILREATPPAQLPLLADLFETITLFENRAVEATYRRREDGKYLVHLTVEAKKLRADGRGNETPIELDDLIDIGVFGEATGEGGSGKATEKVLYLAKHRLHEPRSTLELVVDELPLEAGVDPLNKLVDRSSDDNRKKVGAER